MTTLAEHTRRHHDTLHPGACGYCGERWPCTVQQLRAALERIAAEVTRANVERYGDAYVVTNVYEEVRRVLGDGTLCNAAPRKG